MAALSLDTLRRAIRTSIYGSRLGLDTTADEANVVGGSLARGGMLVGMPGIRLPIQTISTTVVSSIYASGYVEFSATTGSSYMLKAPIPGCEVIFHQTSTSTIGFIVASSGANFNTTTGSSPNVVNIHGQGASLRLVGLSTALWGVLSYVPSSSNGISTAFINFSTF